MSESAMQSPVLVGRYVFFALFIFINTVTLVCAAINIGVIHTSGISVPGAPVFVVINSCALYLFTMVAFAELFAPKARTALIQFECGWTFILSVMQIAASIDVTVNGPPVFCRMEVEWAVCASSAVLVPTSWLSSFSLLAYCLGLVAVTSAHTPMYPAIWSVTVYNAPWFVPPATNNLGDHASQKALPPTPRPKSSSSSIIYSLDLAVPQPFPEDVEKQSQLRDSGPSRFYNLGRNEHIDRPAWAQRKNTIRGRDSPFATFPKARQAESEYSNADEEPANGSRFVEIMLTPSRMEDDDEGSVFPESVHDPDEPIPLPRLCKWVRADNEPVLPRRKY